MGLKKNIFAEAMAYHLLTIGDTILHEYDERETRHVKALMQIDSNWERNNYKKFLADRDLSDYKAFFTPYTVHELNEHGVETFELKGYQIGFALAPLSKGKDIVSVFNNEPEVKYIIDDLLEYAISKGGTNLDHYDTKLSDMYAKNGFKEISRFKWDDKYMNPGWDKEKWGEPGVVVRELDPKLRASLMMQKRMGLVK